MKAYFEKYILEFKRPSGTSRGILKTKDTYFIKVDTGDKIAVGECGLLKTLSIDERPDYEDKLQWLCDNIQKPFDFLYDELIEFPSIQFGLEQLLLDLKSSDKILFPSEFTKGNQGITINGLIWMGKVDFMKEQIEAKLKQEYACVKMKIGAINFEEEFKILQELRANYPKLEIRVDANGAFSPEEALDKLTLLASLNLHSIEQPIRQGQYEEMHDLCQKTPLDIALDEELIGIFTKDKRADLLDRIQPQYIILKPSLIGGIKACLEWIELAENRNIKWWITSALESNIGLNAIAQFTYTLKNPMPQGLGTGGLYTNNINSPLVIEKDKLYFKL